MKESDVLLRDRKTIGLNYFDETSNKKRESRFALKEVGDT